MTMMAIILHETKILYKIKSTSNFLILLDWIVP